MKSLFEYLYTRVRIKTKDGRTLEGDVDSVTCALETESGEDEIELDYGEWIEAAIELDYGEWIEAAGESEIASIEVLAEYRPPAGQLRAAR